MPKKTTTQKGFSIGEVLISAFVLSVGVVSALSLMAQNILETGSSRDLVIASQLAQEGAELARNVRDNNVLTPPSDSDPFAFPGCSGTNCTCRVDFREDGGTARPRLDCGVSEFSLELMPPASNRRYAHLGSSSGSLSTKFQRRLSVEIDRNGTAADYSDDRAIVYTMVVWDRDPGDFPAITNCRVNENCIAEETVLTGWLVRS